MPPAFQQLRFLSVSGCMSGAGEAARLTEDGWTTAAAPDVASCQGFGFRGALLAVATCHIELRVSSRCVRQDHRERSSAVAIGQGRNIDPICHTPLAMTTRGDGQS